MWVCCRCKAFLEGIQQEKDVMLHRAEERDDELHELRVEVEALRCLLQPRRAQGAREEAHISKGGTESDAYLHTLE